MNLLLILLLVATALAVDTIRVVLHDGRGPQRPPSSHFEDPRFRSPAAG